MEKKIKFIVLIAKNIYPLADEGIKRRATKSYELEYFEYFFLLRFILHDAMLLIAPKYLRYIQDGPEFVVHSSKE